MTPRRAALIAWVGGALAWVGGPARAALRASVHPSGDTVPENLLRIELRLAAPLRSPLDLSKVKLRDAAGQEIADPFLDLPLPSADGRRVVLLLHPGRVKSGVGPNVALGRALHEGDVVTLEVDDPAIGPPLRKRWRVTAFDDRLPSPAQWLIAAPVAGTRDPLVVQLGLPISASAEGLIAVRGPAGSRLPGHTALGAGDTRWRFTPARPRQPGAHALVTHPDLESPAGNRTCGAFEGRGVSRIDCDQGTETPFHVARR